MKFRTSIGDVAFLGLFVYSLLTFAMYIFWVVTATWWPAIALTIVLFAIVLPIYFGTKYEIGREELTISYGFIKQTVPFRDIISATDADCATIAPALSHKRISLRYLEGENIKTVYISPTSRDAFRDALNTAMQKSLATLKSQGDLNNIETIEAVEKAKERLAREHELTRAEERAIEAKAEEQKDLVRENLAKEIKKLDDIIDGNIEPESVVLSQEQEDLIASRRKAERKLYAKVRRLKHKRDRAEEEKALREQRVLEEKRVEHSDNVVFEKPKKASAPKKTADEKFADKEREKADKFKAKQEREKQRIEKKALVKAQAEFEATSVYVDKKEKHYKPEISKVKSTNKPKINIATNSAISQKNEVKPAQKSKKTQKKEEKDFRRDVKIEAKKLKKEALAEAKAERKSSAEKLAKQADKINKKNKQ